MNIEALVLIEDDLDAQRLVVTWPQVGAEYAAALAHPEDEPFTAGAHEHVRQRWAEISGVYVEDLKRLEPILFANGILGPEGMVETVVLAFIRSRIARKLPKPARQPQGQQGGS